MSEEEKQLDNPSEIEEQGLANNAPASVQSELSQESEEVEPSSPALEAITDESANPVAPEDRSAVTPEVVTEPTRDVPELESYRQEIEAFKTQLQDSNERYDSLKTQYIRLTADFENFRKRTAKEKQDLETEVKRATISELLSVVDNFERARSQIKPQSDGEMTIHKSYQGVYKLLVDSLKRLGVSPMRPEGKEFDPNIYEAVMRQTTNEHPEGTVLEELQRGYFLGDRVLRHAMVKVAAPMEQMVVSEESDPDATENGPVD
jgi:molecular chaperone GrpE